MVSRNMGNLMEQLNSDTLSLLASAISDVGSWRGWHIKDDTVVMEFCDIQLYDEAKAEKEARSIEVLAVRFRNNTFAVFLDNLTEENWHEIFRNTDSVIYNIDAYDFVFDDIEVAESLLNEYTNKLAVKDFVGPETLAKSKHLLYARCGDVGFVVGGDELDVIGTKGKYTEDEIEQAALKWGDYWRDYWRLRGTENAYQKDYVCEVTIPSGGCEQK